MSPRLSDSVFQARGVADAVCQGEADAAGLVGTFRAWLAADLALGADYSPIEWGPAMRAGGYRFFVAGGGLFADSWDHVLQYTPSSSIDRTAKGELVPPNTPAWTGTWADGTPNRDDCDGWTNSLPLQGQRGAVGITGSGALYWSWARTESCFNPQRLYCFQQP